MVPSLPATVAACARGFGVPLPGCVTSAKSELPVFLTTGFSTAGLACAVVGLACAVAGAVGAGGTTATTATGATGAGAGAVVAHAARSTALTRLAIGNTGIHAALNVDDFGGVQRRLIDFDIGRKGTTRINH